MNTLAIFLSRYAEKRRAKRLSAILRELGMIQSEIYQAARNSNMPTLFIDYTGDSVADEKIKNLTKAMALVNECASYKAD
jgi:ribosome-binding factor A